MNLDFKRREKFVGAFVIGVALLFLTSLVIVGRGKEWFEERVIFYTTFNESYNLQSNAAVKLFKADIGSVDSITLEGEKVRVRLKILAKYASRIRVDSIAVVDSPTLIGSEYISIIPGSPDSPRISEGGEIGSEEKRSVTDILEEFEVEKTARMIVEAIQDLSGLIQTIKDPDGSLMTALNNVEKITSHTEMMFNTVNMGKGTLGELIHSRSVMEKVERNLDKILAILHDIDAASSKTPQIMDQVGDNLTLVGDAGQQIMGSIDAINRILKDAEKAVATLNVVLSNVEEGSRDVPEITGTAKQGIKEIREGVQNIDKIVQSLQKNIIIRSNLPPGPARDDTNAGLRD